MVCLNPYSVYISSSVWTNEPKRRYYFVSASVFNELSRCLAVVFFERLIEVAGVAVSQHGGYFFDGQGRSSQQDLGSVHSLFEDEL